jgi:hypothetical protein
MAWGYLAAGLIAVALVLLLVYSLLDWIFREDNRFEP